ncbi:MAG: glycosyltransferase family 4 protein [Bacteroidota bacterium]
MTDKLFILSLGRQGGSVIYGTAIINRIKAPKEVWSSAFSIAEKPSEATVVKTYNGVLQFLIASFTRLLPMLLKCRHGLKANRYSVFYTPYFHYWNLPFILLFKWYGKQVVITVHDGIPHSGEGKFLEKWLNMACIKRADDIIFLTAFVRNAVKAASNFSGKAHVIPHGPITPEGLLSTNRKFPAKARLLFLGRLGYYKGIDLLINAVKKIEHPAYDGLTIAGKRQKRLPIRFNDSRIKLIDKWHADAEIAELVNTHDILVLPYREATQSGVVTIGISASIPMVCTKTGGLHEQLTDDEAIFVNPEPDDIHKGIQKLLESPDLYEKISQRLVEKRKQLSWESITNKIEKIITQPFSG